MSPITGRPPAGVFVSYAQHAEDVMLYRALGHVRGGFYVDVGAHDPEKLSVTKAFYERGWSGINIEPSAGHFRNLGLHRPRDTNLQLLMAEQPGSREFFEVGTTGLSTMDGELAERYRHQGFGVHGKTMPVSTLDDVLAGHAAREIHFLKVDVEGAEEQVLRGCSFQQHRPWIVVAEATLPLSPQRCDKRVAAYLAGCNYQQVYFDGINSFYLADEHRELASVFDRPPNHFDHYITTTELERNKELADYRNRFGALLPLSSVLLESARRLAGLVSRSAPAQAFHNLRRKKRVESSLAKPLLELAAPMPKQDSGMQLLRHPGNSPMPGQTASRLTSCLAAVNHLESPAFRHWTEALGLRWRRHRKLWEFSFICQALFERGMLEPGRRGLGFAVGEEALPALFASRGCEIMATDLDATDERSGPWAETGQLADSIEKLERPVICAPEDFARLVRFRAVDMNRIPHDLKDFDFTWSSCSFEHCGSIALGSEFLIRQMDCLKPGGVAVHTTEFNLTSNEDTLTEGWTVIFRQRDIDDIIRELERRGHHVEPVCYALGSTADDKFVDVFPYGDEPHLKLLIEDRFVSTSIGLIIRKHE